MEIATFLLEKMVYSGEKMQKKVSNYQINNFTEGKEPADKKIMSVI
ncbi:MAG: hypothetical protein HeimC3_46880 [Candidatus Heimdallarchaeota archaeon LC_3]|nr:MAG: hypothetical protein HeimC3_46880 [Candidatus Heimdallarchaeota archaeon LC_3]